MARRVAKHAIDWVALSNRIPETQKEAFRLFRTTYDKYAQKVNDLPAELPQINFAEYASKISNKAMLDQFEQMYGKVQVPFPKDVDNVMEAVKKEEQQTKSRAETYVAGQQIKMKEVQEILDIIGTVPPPEKMSIQMFNHYFPNMANNPNFQNPGYMPQHIPQLQTDSTEIGRWNTRDDRYMIQLPLEKEADDAKKYQQMEAEKAQELEAGQQPPAKK
ncbi:ATP synthase subunit d, mitochondrial-like [Mya arenaria]|uniref:ATP synthase subunit d, mitochondrial-like n=1 Tax=Mya arenaria TaxID=6604 RepID=UPI0022DF97AB|nr:ATP synthase subunit d, mitochondrial-like [Mya arenaria]